MNTLLEKSWTNQRISSTRKFLSRVLTYRLSRELSHAKYDVVYEGNIDRADPSSEQPDVLIYSSENNFLPLDAIEICETSSLPEMKVAGKYLVDRYNLKEFFIFDYKRSEWYRLVDGATDFTRDSYSPLFKIRLSGLTGVFRMLPGNS